MKKRKILVAGVAAGIVSSVFGAITCGGFFNWIYKIEPTNVWKPMDGAPGWDVHLGFLVLYIILAVVYAVLQKGIPGNGAFAKGSVFGVCMWAAGMLPGMFATYAFMTVAPTVIVYWTISGLISSIMTGVVIAKIYGE